MVILPAPLLGRECQAWLDTGAYADNGPRVTATAGDAAPGPYRWQALDVQSHCVYTNTSPSGSYRAFGATHLQWIAESQVDEVARRLGLDRLEIRRRNLLRPGEEVRPGAKPLDADLIGDVEKAAAAIGWPPLQPDPPDSVAPRVPSSVPGGPRTPEAPQPTSPVTPIHPTKRRGRGVSVGLLAAGAHPVSTATVRMGPDGSVTILSGTTELGQGARTVMAQIAAGVLRAPVGKVVMRGTDTRYTPYDRSTGASRSTTVAGLAVQRAAQDVLDSLLETAAASTHREIETSATLRAAYPELCAMISQVAKVRVRSVGTLGGNLCFAGPHSDPASFLIAADAVMICQRGDTTRRIPAAAFLTGPYQTALVPGELLTAVELPPRPDHAALAHLRFKLTERPAVTVTAMLTRRGNAVVEARLTVGSVGSTPFTADTEILVAAAASDFEARATECAEQAAAGCSPLPDGEASADYLRHLVFIHTRQALREAFTHAS